MYIYQAIDALTGAKITHKFNTEEEANAFAAKNSQEHYSHEIFTEMETGNEEDEIEDELDWEQEEKAILSDMGLDDEETNQGFDYDDFFDNE